MDSAVFDSFPAARAPETPSTDQPAALAELIAAGLVSHELIGDPGQLEAETPTLATICGLVAGPVYRLDRFHYAFRAGPEDLGGRLGTTPPEGWTAALTAALAAAFGPDAVWLTPIDDLPGAEEDEGRLGQPLLLLRAEARAVKEALADAPDVRAVIQARHATEAARLTARLATDLATDLAGDLASDLASGLASDLASDFAANLASNLGADLSGLAGAETPLARRLAEIERRQAEILELLKAEARQTPDPAPDPALIALGETLSGTLTAVARRLDDQTARVDGLAERLAGLAAQLEDGTATGARDPAFHETLGLTLAEFLARLERQAADEATPTRVPRFS